MFYNSAQRSTGVFEQDSLILEFLECRGDFTCVQNLKAMHLWMRVIGLSEDTSQLGCWKLEATEGSRQVPHSAGPGKVLLNAASRGQNGHGWLPLLYVQSWCLIKKRHSCQCGNRKSL